MTGSMVPDRVELSKCFRSHDAPRSHIVILLAFALFCLFCSVREFVRHVHGSVCGVHDQRRSSGRCGARKSSTCQRVCGVLVHVYLQFTEVSLFQNILAVSRSLTQLLSATACFFFRIRRFSLVLDLVRVHPVLSMLVSEKASFDLSRRAEGEEGIAQQTARCRQKTSLCSAPFLTWRIFGSFGIRGGYVIVDN